MASQTAPLKLDFVTLDVFTDTRFLGNPLAVVFIPAGTVISQETKQRVAREFNLSETVFLHTLDSEPNASSSTRRIDIFLTTAELPFAGHPTIGSTYLVLRHLGWTHVDTLLTKAGPIPIQALEDGAVRATIPQAVHIHKGTLGKVLDSASADVAAMIQAGLSDDEAVKSAELHAPVVDIVKGLSFSLVRLQSLEELARVSPKKLEFKKVPGLLDEGETVVFRYYYVVTDESRQPDGSRDWKIRTRSVEPGFEDPATGSAACALSSYLTITGRALEGANFSITQGVEMGRKSDIAIQAVAKEENGEIKIKGLYMGGKAVVVMNGSISARRRGGPCCRLVGSKKLKLSKANATQHIPTTITTHTPSCFAHVLSGEIPEEPVVSRKTGTVFEKRLILKYIEENGKEPGTDDELHPDDLLEIKTSRVVRPRPPNFTSLPSLLKAFQDEWDALVLESYNTKEQLARTREELATALYQHDAAVRVIARLTRERDEARAALSQVTVAPAGGSAANDAMAVDSDTLPEALVAHVEELQSQLTDGRKRRPVPKGWATSEEVASLQQTTITDLSVAHASSLAVQSNYAAIGGLDGKLDIWSIEAGKVERSLNIDEPVTATVWVGAKVTVATAKGSVKVFESGSETATFPSHAGAATGLALHPGKRILASVGADKSFVFYDLETSERVSRVFTDAALTACAFHPDGHLFAAGTQGGDIKVFHTTNGQEATSFALGSPVQAITFSENGFWFAASGKGQSTVVIFDLRKDGEAARAKELQTGDAQALAWDYSGQFLATAGSAGITVQQYTKKSKAWAEPLRSSVAGVALSWGESAKSLVTVNKDGVASVFEGAAIE
ncbi:hypothetical protein QBC47DRAFT_454727 [Echria macrotheca]|uniref:Pre-mRNA-processing factor 19 n=1 Tax=Echria macrotheca TaxID=438768 RepID=A0AAJ0B4C9_9PEZI|nr:hypothetical protein QBC47DRAFT_454727 [Echria macrotheca]